MKFFLLLTLMFSSSLLAKSFSSAGKQVHLIELYTSQSCSSCPPAEKWISNLKSSGELWKDVIPLSYHVTYWDYLSWRDPLAQDAFSSRQRDYHAHIKGGVYTPQFIIDGQDYRSWRSLSSRKLSQDLKKKLKKKKATPLLTARFDEKSRKATMNLKGTSLPSNLICYAAILENGHQANVKAGENAGRSFAQDFVVRKLYQGTMKKQACSFSMKASSKAKKPITTALAFWVMNPKTYQVLQATGGVL